MLHLRILTVGLAALAVLALAAASAPAQPPYSSPPPYGNTKMWP
jgi:hypothetical protein